MVSGQIGLVDDALVAGVLDTELPRALANLPDLLEAEGASLGSVVKTTVFLTDISDYARMDDLCCTAFGDHRPACSVVAVTALPSGFCVEVEAWVAAS